MLHSLNICFHLTFLLCDTKNKNETEITMYSIIFEKNT